MSPEIITGIFISFLIGQYCCNRRPRVSSVLLNIQCLIKQISDEILTGVGQVWLVLQKDNVTWKYSVVVPISTQS